MWIKESPDIKNENFREIILKCIENNPKDRFQTFDEMIIELDKIEIPT